MDVDECFYDELSSFISSPNDYDINHHDFDEIIGSTMSHLDSSLDPNTFLPQAPETSLHSDNLFSDLFPTMPNSHHDLELNFNNNSAAGTQNWTAASSVEAAESGTNLMTFCNDTTEIENITCGNLMEHIQDRDTPSPTESCASFSGSSTSGVHSDTSDAWQNRQLDQNHMPSTLHNVSQLPMPYVQSFAIKNDDSIQKSLQKPDLLSLAFNNQELKSNSIANTAVVAQTTLAPKKVPATVQIPVNMDESLASKPQKPCRDKMPIEHSTESIGKTKTIFLSTNDYKALMDKINLNGSKGTKINGSVKTQIPKIVVKAGNAKVKGQHMTDGTSPTSTRSSSNLHKNPYHIPHSNCNRDTSMEPEPLNYIFKRTIDEKMYKKQQRMIKNRQSASLSRQKKKEYVVSLETRLTNLEKENYTLKGENLSLRNQLVAYAKTCKCRKGSMCEFVLHSLNSTSRPDQHIKIAPKPTSKSFKQHMNAATVKKNIAVLFAMAFMVTLNAGNFQSYLTNQNLDAESTAVVSESNVNDPIPISRRLLWVESEEEYNEKLNQSNRQTEDLVMPPLHFLRPTSRSHNVTKNERWNSTVSSRFNTGNDPPPLSYPSPTKCNGACASSNSSDNNSEYSRLAFQLEKLANASGHLKLSMNTKFNIDRDNSHGFKFSTDYLELPDMERQPTSLGKRKSLLGFKEIPDIEHKQRKMDIRNLNKRNTLNDSEPIHLFKGIKRQDDTFYVLSFNTDHILLSPSTFNKSSRPKMSLLLPTAEPSPNGDIMMMQVDCEVFNTKELELKSHMIPAGLRPNVTKWQIKPNPTSNVNNKTLSNSKFNDTVMKHEKPRVRTFFMVGPKNQAAAAVSQEKPRLVELNKSMANISKVRTADYDPRLHG
ncbi:probable basic-leucine zipper transcription factor J [Drosophila virilis]|uniref:BZIP domain-containing protein n=1 Tax=Drosophila virilis TaxID=7244 RepID=B4LPE9_DROVI|nr:probable basic-leucine zipper transcription factor J [Drosophila virilis]EDW61208.2 uncharacterized protein Dvir_GJ20425 [Drosophila virilis]